MKSFKVTYEIYGKQITREYTAKSEKELRTDWSIFNNSVIVTLAEIEK